MKIVFNRQELLNTITPMMCAVAKTTNPTTEYINIKAGKDEGITLTTYDLEKGVKCTVDGNVYEDGCFCINANKLFQTLKVMEGDDVTLEVAGNLETTIKSGKAHYKIQSIRGEDFPVLPTVSSNEGFEVSAKKLKEMISKVIYAIGISDTRPVLNGAYFRVTPNELMIVTCDSFKLAKCISRTEIKTNADASEKYQYIVPQRTVAELMRMIPDGKDDTVTFLLSRKNMICNFGGLTFYSRLIEGEYIDFDRIIIKNHKISVITDKAQLMAALERAAVVTEEKVAGSTKTPLKFTVEGNLLKLSAVSSVGVAYDELEVEHTGDDIVISFNNKNLIDSVKSCYGDKVKIELSTPLYSINILPLENSEGNEDIFFMMPVRTRN